RAGNDQTTHGGLGQVSLPCASKPHPFTNSRHLKHTRLSTIRSTSSVLSGMMWLIPLASHTSNGHAYGEDKFSIHTPFTNRSFSTAMPYLTLGESFVPHVLNMLSAQTLGAGVICLGLVGGVISPVWAAHGDGDSANAVPVVGGFGVGDGLEGFIDERTGGLRL